MAGSVACVRIYLKVSIVAKIESISTKLFRVPLEATLTDSMHGAMSDFELLTVEIKDVEGATGLGYSYAVNSGGAAFKALVDGYLTPTLLQQDGDEIEGLWQKMWWKIHYGGRGGHATSAISAVDIALWDLKAKRCNLPTWKLLGGYSPQVPIYAGGIDLEFSIPDLLRQADGFQEKGIRAIKMKVGRESQREDVERVKAMREHLGADFPLMVDANMRWTADQAIAIARRLQEFNLLWLEEPTIPDDIEGSARILREGGVPVACGENLHTIYEFKNLMAANGLSFAEPDVCNCGGMTSFRKIGVLAEAHNLPLTSHGAHNLTVHLMAAAPNRSYMELHGFSLDAYLKDPLAIKDGFVSAPDRPGNGVEFIWKALEPHRI